MGIIPTRLSRWSKKSLVTRGRGRGSLASRDPVKGPRMAAKYGQESYQTLIESERGHLARFQIEPKQFEESLLAHHLHFFFFFLHSTSDREREENHANRSITLSTKIVHKSTRGQDILIS